MVSTATLVSTVVIKNTEFFKLLTSTFPETCLLFAGGQCYYIAHQKRRSHSTRRELLHYSTKKVSPCF